MDDLAYIREQRAKGAEGWSGADIDYLLGQMDGWRAKHDELKAQIQDLLLYLHNMDPLVSESIEQLAKLRGRLTELGKLAE